MRRADSEVGLVRVNTRHLRRPGVRASGCERPRARLVALMRCARPGPRFLLLGFLALLALLGGPAGASVSGPPPSEARGVAGSVGITDSLLGGDAVLPAKPEARERAWGQRVRPPETIYTSMALAVCAAVTLIRRHRWRLVAGRPRLATTRQASGVRGPPLLQSA